MYNKKEFDNKQKNLEPRTDKNGIKEFFSVIPMFTKYSAMKSLSGNAYKVWDLLASQKDCFSLSNIQIAEHIGISEREVYKALNEIASQGFIEHDKYHTIKMLYPIEAKPKMKNKKRIKKPKIDENHHVEIDENQQVEPVENQQNIPDENQQHNKECNKDINKDINIYAETSLEVSAYNDTNNSNKSDLLESQKELLDMINSSKENSLNDLLTAYNICSNSDLKRFEYSHGEKRRINKYIEQELISSDYYNQYLNMYQQYN